MPPPGPRRGGPRAFLTAEIEKIYIAAGRRVRPRPAGAADGRGPGATPTTELMGTPLSEVSLRETIDRIQRRQPQYDRSAYVFVLAALHRRLNELESPRHLEGRELAEAVRQLALETFGLMARTVLEHWGVHTTSDLGNIVYLLVEHDVLITQATDTREDFEEVYSFEEGFDEDYPWASALSGRTAGP